MRVIAATFSEPSQAAAAREVLERELEPAQVEVAPLAHPGEATHGEAVLAGHFSDDVAPDAVRLVVRAGGEIVANIDVRWTGISRA